MKISGAGLFNSLHHSKNFTYTMLLFRMKPNKHTNGSGCLRKKSSDQSSLKVLSGQEAMWLKWKNKYCFCGDYKDLKHFPLICGSHTLYSCTIGQPWGLLLHGFLCCDCYNVKIVKFNYEQTDIYIYIYIYIYR